MERSDMEEVIAIAEVLFFDKTPIPVPGYELLE